MSQSSASLAVIVLNASSITVLTTVLTALAGSVAYIFKQTVDLKNQEIHLKDKEIDGLKVELTKAENLREEIQRILIHALEDFENYQPSPQDLSCLQNIIRLLKQYENIQEELSDYKKVAECIKVNQKTWINEGVRAARRDYKKLILRNKIHDFEEDINQCLEWAYMCLKQYGHTEIPIEEFLTKPSIETSYLPYISAISHIKQVSSNIPLTVDQGRYMQDIFDKLLNKISSSGIFRS